MYIYKGKIIEPESDFGKWQTVVVTKSFCVSYLRCDGEVRINSDYSRNCGYNSYEYEASFRFNSIDEAVGFYKEVMKFIKGKESEFKVVDLTFTPFSIYEEKEYRKDKFYLEVVDNKPYISTYNGYITSDTEVSEADEYSHTTFNFSVSYEFDSLPELARNMDKCLVETKYFIKKEEK